MYIASCMRHAMPWVIWSSEAVLHYQVHLLWFKHRNLSLSKLRVGLRLHLSDWGAGIDVACRLCTHYIDNLVLYAPMQLLGMWLSFSYWSNLEQDQCTFKPCPYMKLGGLGMNDARVQCYGTRNIHTFEWNLGNSTKWSIFSSNVHVIIPNLSLKWFKWNLGNRAKWSIFSSNIIIPNLSLKWSTWSKQCILQ